MRRMKFLRAIGILLAIVVVLVGGVLAYGASVLVRSRPALDGTLHLAGLSAPVQVARDANGVPTIDAANRADLARALGFLHGQERFFQMDLLRRDGAGELSGLVGAAALPVDRKLRLHRFRERVNQVLATQTPAQRAVVVAYTAGVNAGLAALGHTPWEYTLLRVSPLPWTEADTSLVAYAMYFDLQDSDATHQVMRAATERLLGPAAAAFLLPHGTPHDAPLDGSVLPDVPVPASLAASGAGQAGETPPEHGSNNFAVAGRLTSTGAAMVANDMHLGLNVPNIWYRARMRVAGGPDGPLDLVGVTLPGVPYLVVGSNTHVAWGFTDGYIESGDAVVIDPVPGAMGQYMTPDGPKPIQHFPEKLCPAHADCETLTVDETIWGPVVAHDSAGHPIVWAWTAHDPSAVNSDSIQLLERAVNVRQALDAAHQTGIPQQNMVVGDSTGHLAWTIIGQIPRRTGLDDEVPHSWADGKHGWHGYLRPDEIPEIVDPPDGRLWTANARVVGGDALEKLGDGGYAEGLRAERIRNDLHAREHFAEPDLLAIQTDDHAVALSDWQKLLLATIDAHAGDTKAAAMRSAVQNWGGFAVPESVGYRLVHAFRALSIRTVFGGLMQKVTADMGGDELQVPGRSAWPVQRLLTQRPAALVPPPYKSWDDVTGAVLGKLEAAVDANPGGLAAFTWGQVNHTGIHHVLARAVPLLGLLTDPPDLPEAGDTLVPRVQVPGEGASERLVVSPGHEASALFEMPVGESDNPLSPYYLAGQREWQFGTPAPLLPGAAKWRLELR